MSIALEAGNRYYTEMSTVAEIESAIEKLQPEEVKKVAAMLSATDAVFSMYDEEEQSPSK
jgi:hypothetical protein